jgi:hypothetical protein
VSLAGQTKKEFVVTVDPGLLAKHGLRIQEGPVLCSHRLMLELGAADEERRVSQLSLAEQDILSYLATLLVPETADELEGARSARRVRAARDAARQTEAVQSFYRGDAAR